MKKLTLLVALLMISVASFSQESEVEMATTLRSSGKIYVVVSVIAVIFIGIAAYLFSIDRKVRRLEKKDQNQI